jgi:hypothetical protein
MRETERELKICAELPDVSENDVDVRLEDDVLVIRGEKKFERKRELPFRIKGAPTVAVNATKSPARFAASGASRLETPGGHQSLTIR